MSRASSKQGTILAVSTAVVSVAVAGVWWVFRRPCKRLTNDNLPPTFANNGIQVVPTLTKEERDIIKKAFLAGPDFRYLVGGKNYKTGDFDEQQHYDVTSNLVEYMISFCEQYGHLLVCRNGDGTFLGAVGLIPPYRYHMLFTLHFYRTVIPRGKPAPLKMGNDIAARFTAFGAMMQLHEDCMKGIPHWYVQVIGVSDKAQGKGVGTKLMNAAMDMAGDMPMYLDCHYDNVPYYEKFGFIVKKKIEIVPKGIQDTSTLEMNGMVRGLKS